MRWVRLAAAVALFVSAWALGRGTGLHEQLDTEGVRRAVEDAGAWGLALFVGIFALGQLLHVPGLVFVAAAMFVYGRLTGTVVSLVGAVIAVTVSFVVVRAVGGQPLASLRRPFARRMLDRLDARPVTSVALLRLVFIMAPPVNYALAMSNLRLRDYVAGSGLGLLGPVTLAALLFDWLFAL
jgi:uncharacterized membrane protein YdjX (TVP38/TMEM64 family)